MIDQQIIDYIKRQLDHGVEKEKVRNFLVSNGWQASVIDEVFNFLASNSQNISPEPTASQPTNVTQTAINNVNKVIPTADTISSVSPEKKSKIGLITILVIVGILVIAGGAFAFLYFTKSPILDGLLNRKIVEVPIVTQEETPVVTEEPVVEDIITEPTVVEDVTTTPIDETTYGYAYGEVTEPIVVTEKPDMTLDSDNDGLTNAEEEAYGTDMNNPDTDGDTYKDGDEVKNGYDPLGPGKLAP